MQKQFSSILDLELFFSNEKPWPSLLQHQGGLGVVVGVFLQERFFNASLQIAPWQGFHNIEPNQYKEKQQMGVGRHKASHIHKALATIHELNC